MKWKQLRLKFFLSILKKIDQKKNRKKYTWEISLFESSFEFVLVYFCRMRWDLFGITKVKESRGKRDTAFCSFGIISFASRAGKEEEDDDEEEEAKDEGEEGALEEGYPKSNSNILREPKDERYYTDFARL